MTTLWQSCGQYLEQARSLAVRLDPVQYRMPHTHCFGGTIGGHLRHCIEHFELFRNGLADRCIDYDRRNRGSETELDPETAVTVLTGLIEFFAVPRGELNDPVEVRVDCGDSETTTGSQSTIGRELQFLVSHTVHHFALIAVMCGSQGIALPEDFGVAPSTLKYREQLGRRA